MPHIIPWPPEPLIGPPQNQYEIGRFLGWNCAVSHIEPGPNGPSPHYVVDWDQKLEDGKPYPFMPSSVPEFLVEVWQRNAAINRKNVRHTIDEIHDAHWGLPVYVVGTGPSLAKNMDNLRNVKDGIIIATNNAINILPEDIRIDYYCAVDGRLPERWWKNCKRNLKEIRLIAVPLVTPKITEYFSPDNIYWARFAGSEGPNKCFAFPEYDKMECLEPGYVVGYTATNAAFYVGGNPIVFVGMDCCITNGYLHAGDKSKAYIVPGEEYVVMPDMYGGPQVTSSTYCRGMFKIQAATKLNGKNRRFINASEGGIMKEFMNIVPLHEVVSWEQ